MDEARYYRDRKLRQQAAKILRETGIPRKCAKCSYEYDLQIHHVNGYELDNRLENLVYLCRECHLKEHDPYLRDVLFGVCSVCHRKRELGYLSKVENRQFICDLCFKLKRKEQRIPWFKNQRVLRCPNCGHKINLHARYTLDMDGKWAFCYGCGHYIELDRKGEPKSWHRQREPMKTQRGWG